MNDGKSEIDDPKFFFAKNGRKDAQAELLATIDAFYSDANKDDNSSICHFPERYNWLSLKLHATDFPIAKCQEYNKVLKRVDPVSATLVFPSAHINSPASMFGHTFIRVNSSYHSRLLSYAVNYAADANVNTENGVIFAIKGLTGGYKGRYSLLPYYDKLKEYRDSEQRDIWEYDLNLTPKETARMFRHVWELNSIGSDYYFLTQNCSYNMLWLLEVARPTVHLRNHFTFEVSPLETVKVVKQEHMVNGYGYRASKRTLLLKYESLISKMMIDDVRKIAIGKKNAKDIIENEEINATQKKYILEASIEYLQYKYTQAKIKKEKYLTLFHTLTSLRATLGKSKPISMHTPNNPIDSHDSARAVLGVALRDHTMVSLIGIRPTYHDLGDASYGLLRGTQIEFLNLLLSTSKQKVKLENATLLSIVSLAQRSTFFQSLSWRAKIGWDSNYLDKKARFQTRVGAGYSWGDKYGYFYLLADPFVYMGDKINSGVGASIGMHLDRYSLVNTNFEATQRLYDTGNTQLLLNASVGLRTSKNTQIMLKYDYKDRKQENILTNEQTIRVMFKCFF